MYDSDDLVNVELRNHEQLDSIQLRATPPHVQLTIRNASLLEEISLAVPGIHVDIECTGLHKLSISNMAGDMDVLTLKCPNLRSIQLTDCSHVTVEQVCLAGIAFLLLTAPLLRLKRCWKTTLLLK